MLEVCTLRRTGLILLPGKWTTLLPKLDTPSVVHPALRSVLVSGIILRASIANSIRPIQGLLGYAPALSEPLSSLLEESSAFDARFKIQDRFLQIHGGRMDVHLRALVEQPQLPWAEVQDGVKRLSEHIQQRLDESMDALPEGKLTVQLTLDEVRPH